MKQGSTIKGVIIKDLDTHTDARGWLVEVFRADLQDDTRIMPVMAYVSCTKRGVVRGAHEHIFQTDAFCFLGHFLVQLWDNRADSPTKGVTMRFRVADNPKLVIIPPGVVHAYKALKPNQLVLNLPDQLYRGWGGKDDVDEIRYEGTGKFVLS